MKHQGDCAHCQSLRRIGKCCPSVCICRIQFLEEQRRDTALEIMNQYYARHHNGRGIAGIALRRTS